MDTHLAKHLSRVASILKRAKFEKLADRLELLITAGAYTATEPKLRDYFTKLAHEGKLFVHKKYDKLAESVSGESYMTDDGEYTTYSIYIYTDIKYNPKSKKFDIEYNLEKGSIDQRPYGGWKTLLSNRGWKQMSSSDITHWLDKLTATIK